MYRNTYIHKDAYMYTHMHTFMYVDVIYVSLYINSLNPRRILIYHVYVRIAQYIKL
jgi:hypothetical protein